MKPWEMNTAICEALGLDPTDVSHVEIVLDGLDWPKVTVTRHVDEGDVDALSTLIERYKLTPNEEH